MGAGFFLGCWVLGIRPHWPPREDLDRLLALVLPAVMVVELLAAFPGRRAGSSGRCGRPSRRVARASCCYGSSYLTDLAGPGTREWSPGQAWLILGGLAAARGTVWVLLAILARRAPGLSHASMPGGHKRRGGGHGDALRICDGRAGRTAAGGCSSGGRVAVLVLPRSSRATGPIGVAIVALFSLLVIGRFFGQLTSAHAILLFCAPLLGWLPELPYLRRLPPWTRGLARVILVGALVSVVVVDAQRKFVEDSKAPSGSEPNEPSIQDYMDFGR